MEETSFNDTQTQAPLKSSKTKVTVTAIIAAAIVALACIASFITTVILVLDAIPFYHIFPH